MHWQNFPQATTAIAAATITTITTIAAAAAIAAAAIATVTPATDVDTDIEQIIATHIEADTCGAAQQIDVSTERG